MEKHDFVTIADLTREKILYMIEMAQEFERHPNRELLKGKVVATLFFEPSTRTRLSFETAANRLGARVIGFADPKITSGTKGETLKDTISMVANYADVIVMRHYIEGAAQYASEVTEIPIVNAGDGAHQHPSQCMLDLYSIYKTQGTLENLNIYLVGDLKYGRTVHSLIMAMRHFNPTFHFVAPKELAMPQEYKLYCKEHGIQYQEHTAFNEKVIADADILYMTRVQRERFFNEGNCQLQVLLFHQCIKALLVAPICFSHLSLHTVAIHRQVQFALGYANQHGYGSDGSRFFLIGTDEHIDSTKRKCSH